MVEAATSKYLGNRFELATLDFMRPVLTRCDERIRAMFDAALLASPKSGLRGGAAPVMLAIVHEGNPMTATVLTEEAARLAATVADVTATWVLPAAGTRLSESQHFQRQWTEIDELGLDLHSRRHRLQQP